MAGKPLRSQLNQIRAWVRQGRTDAWIAHQLDVSAAELREFRRRHELSPEDEEASGEDLRDEIEAEIEATMSEDEDDEDEENEDQDEGDEPEAEKPREDGGERREREDGGARKRGRRRRRRRGGSKRAGAGLQATFDHGTDDGFGLWLDPAVEDDPIYAENWAGHRKVEVTIEPERIVIKRSSS